MSRTHHSDSVSLLIADDDRSMLLWAREALQPSGFTLIEASNGLQALEQFHLHRPDLVILDIHMPEMDGYTVCDRIRQNSDNIDIPILMATGSDDINSVDRAFDAGATDFFTKPVNWPLLVYRIRYMLRNSQLMSELIYSKKGLADAQRIAHIGNWIWDIASNEIQVSEELYRIIGSTPVQTTPSLYSILTLTEPQDRKALRNSILETFKTGQATSVKFRITRLSGEKRILFQRNEAGYDTAGQVISIHGIIQDITERQQAEDKIHHLAYFDNLTDLPNRRLFWKRATTIISRAQQSDQQFALFFINLNKFGLINDTLGHSVGDALLKAISEKLNMTLRGPDNISRHSQSPQGDLVARIGGDEFAILLNLDNCKQNAAIIARRLLQQLSQSFQIGSHTLSVTASIGIALYPRDADDIATLFKQADIAMSQAKKSGINNFQLFDTGMNDAVVQRVSLEKELRSALDKGEFYLEYQPQINTRTGSIVGLEALIRWQNPKLGKVTPDKFIPIAEETGLILPIGEWVLNTACAQLYAWQQQGFNHLRMAVNLSTRQFIDVNLVSQIGAVLIANKLDAEYLELEITESLLLQDVEHAIEIINALRTKGINLALDDFGTGYSSLSYLQKLSIDRLKIDRSFIQDIMSNKNNAAIASAIIVMSHSLGLEVVAEGVETREQQAVLKNMGCDELQGYFFSKPVAKDQIPALLQQCFLLPISATPENATF